MGDGPEIDAERLDGADAKLDNTGDLLAKLSSDVRNLLDSTQAAAIFLDGDVRIRSFTPAVAELFPLQAADKGRLLTDIASHLDHGDLTADVEEAHRSLSTVEREVDSSDLSAAYLMRVMPYRTADNRLDGTVITFIDITERQRQDEQIRVIMREMLHRTNNLLAVILAMAGQTARHSESFAEFDKAFRARLISLADSNSLLVKTNWRGAAIEDLARSQLVPFIDQAPHRLVTSGPTVHLLPIAAQGIGLALHELATNALKFGALTTPEGKITLNWKMLPADPPDRPTVRLVWQEHGGPRVGPASHRGFGLTVAMQMVETTLGAKVGIKMAPEGVRWQADVPALHCLP